MKPLPHALLRTTANRPHQTGRHIALVHGDVSADSQLAGSVFTVDGSVTVDALRFAICRGSIGVALSACRSGADIQRLATLLAVAEAEEGRADAGMVIFALTDGILPAPASPQGFARKSPRLAGIVFDAGALAQILGVSADKAADVQRPPFAAARAAVLLAAAAAGVPAFDAAIGLDSEAFKSDCAQSRDMGFYGRIAVSEAQVSIIDAIYGA